MATESGFQIPSGAPHFYDLHVRGLMKPFVDRLVAATVVEGWSVLDVACGTGFATRAAAGAAGQGARVEGCDLNGAMIAQARSTPDTPGSALVWREASALDLPYEVGEFDVTICQQGLQFFPDPAAGIREMVRVTRPGGRIGVTVWSPLDGSPFFDSQSAMLVRLGEGPAAAFSATEQQLRSWFEDGGVPDIAVERVVVTVDLPPVKEFLPQQLRALPWSAPFFALSPTQQESALGEMEADLAEFRTGVGITVPFSSYLATATLAGDRTL